MPIDFIPVNIKKTTQDKRVDNLEAKMEGLERLLSNLPQTDLTPLESQINELKNDIEKLKEELPEFEVKISARQKEFLEKKLKEFESSIVKILKKKTENQNNFLARFTSRKFLITIAFIFALFFDNTRQIIVDYSGQLMPVILGYI